MKWLFGNKKEENKQEIELSLCVDSLGSSVSDNINEFQEIEPDKELIRAQLADFYRRGGLPPFNPEMCLELLSSLDKDSIKRLAILIDALIQEDENSLVIARLSRGDVGKQVNDLFISFAKTHDVLSADILLQSSMRREEFVRHFIKQSGAKVEGESEKESEQRLYDLDYKRLLEEASKARNSAQDRVDYLKKLQEEQENKLGRRGKW